MEERRSRMAGRSGSGPLGAVAQICWLGQPAQASWWGGVSVEEFVEPVKDQLGEVPFSQPAGSQGRGSFLHVMESLVLCPEFASRDGVLTRLWGFQLRTLHRDI